MTDDQKPKIMDINDLVKELSKSSTSPVTSPQPVAPQPPRPSFPTPPSTSSGPTTRPSISIPPSVQPKPAPTLITPPPTSGVKEYQSSIRTMGEDISKLKQGQQPMGVPFPRKVEQIVPAPQPLPSKPVMPSPQFKIPDVNLGEIRKAAPMAPTKSVPSPQPTPPLTPKVEPKSQIYVPQEGSQSGNRNMLYVGIGAKAIVAGFSYWFFVLRAPAPVVVEESPVPTPIQTPTPTPFPFEKLGIAEKISIPSTSVFLSSLTTEMSVRQPMAGQIKVYDIVDENQQKYSFKEFLTKLSIDTATLNDSGGLLDTKEWVLGSYGQIGTGQGGNFARPFIVITQKDSASATSLMNTWESRIINDLSKLFNLGKLSPQLSFTSDAYSGVSFRFVRIPDRDLGVAYAVFQNYLILGSSRDSFRAVIDTLTTP